MQKAKTTWRAQNLIVDDDPSRSLCKPHFYTDEICGWMVLCGRTAMRSGFHREAGAQEPRNQISIHWDGLALHNMSIGGQGSRNRDGGRTHVRFRHS